MKRIIDHVRRSNRKKSIRAKVTELVLLSHDRRLHFACDVANGFADKSTLTQRIAKRHAEWIARRSRSNLYTNEILNALANRAFREGLFCHEDILSEWRGDDSDAARLIWTSVDRLETVLDRAKEIRDSELRLSAFQNGRSA